MESGRSRAERHSEVTFLLTSESLSQRFRGSKGWLNMRKPSILLRRAAPAPLAPLALLAPLASIDPDGRYQEMWDSEQRRCLILSC